MIPAARNGARDAATRWRNLQGDCLRHLAARCPYLYPLVRAMDGHDNSIQVGSDTMPVTRGVLQGDSVAPVIFAAVLWHTWQQLDEELRRSVRPMFYADDTTIAGDVGQLRQVYRQLRERGPQTPIARSSSSSCERN